MFVCLGVDDLLFVSEEFLFFIILEEFWGGGRGSGYVLYVFRI